MMARRIRYFAAWFFFLAPALALRGSSPTSDLKSKQGFNFASPANGISLTDTLVGSFSHKWMRNLNLLQSVAAGHQAGEKVSLRRSLAIGDFNEFNALFKDAVIRIGDFPGLEASNLDLDIRNLLCTNMEVGDILVSYEKLSLQKLTFQVEIVDLNMDCNMDYDYKYNIPLLPDPNGSGAAKATTKGNDASVTLAFESPNFDTTPPTTSSLESCGANINVKNISFDGGFVAGILNIFKGLISNVVEEQVENVACDELGSLGTTLVGDMLDLASDLLNPYLGVVLTADPLAAENSMVVPDNVNLLDLQDTENSIGQWFDAILQEADALLGTEVEDPEDPSGWNLGVNVFLRKYLLDQDRALTLEVDTLFPDGVMLFEGHDKLTETTIELNAVKVFGLDTFSKFEPLIDIGRYTLQNELAWDYLTIELDVTITIKPSTLDDSVIEEPSASEVVETVKIDFGVENLDTVVSLLLAVDQDKLEEMQLGPLLDTANLLPCLLSRLFQIQLSELTVSVGSILEPTLDDFVSAGIDRVVSKSVEAVFAMYETVLRNAVPNMFHLDVMDIINKNFIQEYMQEPENLRCEVDIQGGGHIDFRDLLLEPDVALSVGGSGEAPYGNLVYTLMPLLQDQFGTLDDSGLPKINSMVIGPLTESQSGVEGMVRLQEAVFDIDKDVTDIVWSYLVERFQLKIFDTRIQNLDTLTDPLTVLKPTSNPRVLTNLLTLGPVQDRSLNGTLRLLLALDGNSPLSMRNEMDISVSVPSAGLLANFLATIVTDKLLEFPVKNIFNYNCWLATIPSPELDENGNYIEPDSDPTLALSKFLLNLGSLDIGVDCVSCTSSGLAILPDLISDLQLAGVVSVLRDSIESFAGEVLQGDWLQLVVDRFIHDAPKLCPHSPSYDAGAVATDFGSPGFPTLSRDSMETVVLAGAVAAQVALFVAAESHVMMPEAEFSDPLSGQAGLKAGPPGMRLIDFTDLGGSVGPWAEMLLEEAKELMSGSTDGSDFEASQFIQDFLLDDDGVLRIAFDDIGFEGAGVMLELTEIRITGLDSIAELDLLDAIGPQTLQNNLKLDRIGVEVGLTIGVGSDDTEDMTLSFGMSDVNVNLAFLLALDFDKIGNLELGSILHIKQILPCLLSTVWDANVSQLLVSIGNFEEPTVEGFISDPLRDTISSSIQSLFGTYNSTLIAAVPTFSQVTVRGLLNRLLQAYIDGEENSICPSMAMTKSSLGFVDFRELLLPRASSMELGGSGESPYGDLLRTVFDILKKQMLDIDPVDGTSSINDLLIRPLTKGQSNVTGTLSFPGDLFNQDSTLSVGGLNARIELKAYNARIENLDTVGQPLELLQPVTNEPSTLNNTATFAVGEDPLRFTVTLLIALTGDGDMQVRNEVEISVDLESASVILGALVKISEEPFLSFPLRDVTKFDCWLATIPAPPLDSRGIRASGYDATAALANLAVSIARMDLNITCISCSGPDLEDLASVLSSPEAVDDATEVANKVLDYVTNLLGGEFLQIQIDRILNDAAKKCPHSDAYQVNPTEVVYESFESSDRQESSVTFLIAIVVATACLFVAVVVILCVVKCIVRRRHRVWLRSLTNENIVALHREQQREVEINQATKSMFTSSSIPCYVRYFIPIVILGNIAFFLSGHLSLGATVNIEAQLAGEAFTVEKFFEFSMAQSTVDIYEAGGKELAILILLFSGVWPYTKQIITLVLWFLPPRIVSATRRGSILYWLDALAKWSMVDIFALVISIAAFRVSVESPDVAFLTDNFYSIDLMVVPLWGLYANMIAQLISQVSSHFIIHYHRRIIAVAKQDNELGRQLRNADTASTDDNDSSRSGSEIENVTATEVAETRDQLCQHAFVRPHRGNSDKLQVRRGVNAIMVIVAIAIVFLVVFGCSRPTFSVEVLGIIGVAVESGQGFKKASTEYSVFSIVGLLIEEARFLDSAGDYIGLGVLSILVILSVLVVPLIQTLVLLRQWFTPMARARRAKITIAVEILQAWQYIEVYLIAVIVSAWQLGPVSDFMINEYCDDLEPTFATLVYYGIIDPRDAQCFMVQASVENATYMLIAAAILLALLNTFVMKAVAQYSRDTDPSLTRFEANPKQVSMSASMRSEDDIFQVMEKIHPVPVMFSDTFRWVLRREDAVLSRNMVLGLSDAKLGVEDGFPEVASETESKTEIDGGIPVMLSYPGKSQDGSVSSDAQSEGAANFAANDTFGDEGFSENSAMPVDHDKDDPARVSTKPRNISKKSSRALSSFRSLFSLGSSESSRMEEVAWKCDNCSYDNADAKNSTCALCGLNRNVPSTAEVSLSPSTSDLASSILDGDASTVSGPSLTTIQEHPNETT